MPKKKILIVDDEKEMVELEVMRFEAHGYEVCAAYDGESGIKMVHQKSPDLVILDIMLPGADGYAVCQTLKADPKTKNIPIILVSAVDQKHDPLKAKEVGANYSFTKPYESPQLLAKIRELLQPSQRAK